MDTEKTTQPFDPASFEHVPVLLNECLDGLKIDKTDGENETNNADKETNA